MIDLSWNTKGRLALADYRVARRKHFLMCLIPLGCYVGTVLVNSTGAAISPTAAISLSAIFVVAGSVLLFYYRYRFLQVMVRRLHDRGMSGKLLILSPLLFIALLVGFAAVVTFSVATPGGNPALERWLSADNTSIASLGVIVPFILFNLFLRFQMNKAGTPGANRFGPPPGAEQAQVF